ncbi:MAG: hypothetical protein J6K84_04415 [Oscillospiraceae bacterium]|nr:hypothetical protein [Oscillospiraceae bacterium]
MGTSKLKNMVLLLLTIVNVALLVLVIPTRLGAKRQASQGGELLSSLFQQENIRLDANSIPDYIPVTQSALRMEEGGALNACKVLLGEDMTWEEDIYGTVVTSLKGYGLIQGNTLSLTLARPTVDPMDFTAQTLKNMNSAEFHLTQETQGDVNLITAEFYCEKLPVVGGEMVFRYEKGILTWVSGFFLPQDATTEPQRQTPCLVAKDALVAFLEHAQKTAWTGEELFSLRQCWMLEGGISSAYFLQPLWQIETDGGLFTVDGLSSAVSAVS